MSEQKSEGFSVIVVGQTRSGKSTLSRKMIESRKSGMPVMIYDINREYVDIYPAPFDKKIHEFLEIASKQNNTYLLFEEATIFFDSNKRLEEMKELLVRKRHTGNIIHLNFHSFASMPKYIRNLLNIVIIFKTGDTEKDVKEKFDNPKILEAFHKVRNSKDPHAYEIITIG